MAEQDTLTGARRVFWTGYSIVYWLFVAISSILLFPVALLIWLITAPIDSRKRLLHLFTCFWASLYTWVNPMWPVRIDGRLRDEQATIFVANHLSLVDIFVLFRSFAHFKWVSKIEVFRLPFVGWNMRLNDYIPIDRGNRRSVAKMLRQCELTLRRGSSIMMFPEGTRSVDGKLRAFKPGAFELALRTRCAIQPILIEGSSEALPKHGLVLRGRHPIRVTVLPVMEPESFANHDPESLAQAVRSQMAKALGHEGDAASDSNAPRSSRNAAERAAMGERP